jgi:hypothetical protein
VDRSQRAMNSSTLWINAPSSEMCRRTLKFCRAIVATCVACMVLPAVVTAGTLTVNINSYVNGCGMFTFNDPYHFIAPCSGTSSCRRRTLARDPYASRRKLLGRNRSSAGRDDRVRQRDGSQHPERQ